MCEWAIPSQNSDWNSTRDHEPPQHLGMRRPTRQTKTREPLDIQHSSNHKPSLPANVLQNLIKDIKTKPMEVCFACALPYASALHGTPSEQGHHLSAWNEICKLAQGIKPTLSMISPQQWAKKVHDPLGRKLHRHLEGRKIALKPPHEEGHSRKGCVLLVSKASGSGRPRAYIKLDEPPAPKNTCIICNSLTPAQKGKTEGRQARSCTECNQTYHKKCIPDEHRPRHFPQGSWNCPRCMHMKTPTPKIMIAMHEYNVR